MRRSHGGTRRPKIGDLLSAGRRVGSQELTAMAANTPTTENSTVTPVTGAEVQRWIAAVDELYPEACDRAGGVAPRTIKEHVGSERAVRTIRRHLSDEAAVTATVGIHGGAGGSGRRTSFLPAEADR